MVILTRMIEMVFYPPCGPLALVAVGAIVLRWRRRWGTGLMVAGWLVLYLTATPLFASALTRAVESPVPVGEITDRGASAIVILGGPDRYNNAPEYGGHTVGIQQLGRLRYGARLHRRTKLPILVVGGDVHETGVSEAQLMAAALREDFRVEVRWEDGRSKNTFDNARHAWEVLSKEDVASIILVTQAWHMPRAARAFEDQGFRVTQAPTMFYSRSPHQQNVWTLIPNVSAMERVRWALHEIAGRVWYSSFGP